MGKVFLRLYEIFFLSRRRVPLGFFLEHFEARALPIETALASNRLHIFIPYRNKVELTVQCLASLFSQQLPATEVCIHLIDNGSSTGTHTAIQEFLMRNKPSHFEVIQHHSDQAFNFSRLCNIALQFSHAQEARTYFLFLNNDIILEDCSSLLKMLSFMGKNPDAGALGVTLIYPNRRVQHIFAAPGVKIVAAHPFKGIEMSQLREWSQFARKVPAVTGACLMVPSTAFHHVGGFDEMLPTVGQDIDFCLKLKDAGYSSWSLPQVVAVHFESASRRGTAIARKEVEYIHAKWGPKLTQNEDYPLIISRWSEQPAFRLFEREYPYRLALHSK